MRFRIVDNEEVTLAFRWHREFAELSPAVYPRSLQDYRDLVYERSVWCACNQDNSYQAMSYATMNSTQDEWEIGGLMVSPEARGKGLGRVMMRLPLAHMLVNENPLSRKPRISIVTHVLATNTMPRGIVDEVGFCHFKKVQIPKDCLPGLQADEDGYIRGDEFHLGVPTAVFQLADWCDGWTGQLSDGTAAEIDILDGLTLAVWATALREMADACAAEAVGS